MLCSISNEPPEEPVISRSSGHLFEKRLIEQYIQQHGTHPVTKEPITTDDLVAVHTARVVQPRAPAQTSLPALLKTFQNEWDACTLELYTVSEKLKTTQKELATALYQNDAAVRCIARLKRERDEARHALSNLSVSGPPAGQSSSGGSGEAMEVDNAFSEALIEIVNTTKEERSKGRKKRAVPAGTATADGISEFTPQNQFQLPLEQVAALDVGRDFVAVGGPLSNSVVFYSKDQNDVSATFTIDAPVLGLAKFDALETMDEKCLVACTTGGSVAYFVDGELIDTLKGHVGPVNGVAVHPSGKIVATVGADRSMNFYDINACTEATRSVTDAVLTACAFHPDGHLFAAGSETGDIKLYGTISRQHMATFTIGAPVQAIVFSENGYHLAVAGKGLSTVTVFDLRKEGDAACFKVFEHDGPVDCLAWDDSAQFLAMGGSSGVSVQQWVKSSKSWNEIFKSALPAVALGWSHTAKQLVVSSREGLLTVLSNEE